MELGQRQENEDERLTKLGSGKTGHWGGGGGGGMSYCLLSPDFLEKNYKRFYSFHLEKVF